MIFFSSCLSGFSLHLSHTFRVSLSQSTWTLLELVWITQWYLAQSMRRHRIFLSVFISGVDVTGKSKFGRLTHAGAQRGLVARLIGNGNNWPLGSICLMGGIGNQSYCLFGSLPCNSSMEASLSDGLCISCILCSDHTGSNDCAGPVYLPQIYKQLQHWYW